MAKCKDIFRFYCIINGEDHRIFNSPSKVEDWGNQHYSGWAEKYKNQLLLFDLISSEKKDNMIIEGYCGNDFSP